MVCCRFGGGSEMLREGDKDGIWHALDSATMCVGSSVKRSYNVHRLITIYLLQAFHSDGPLSVARALLHASPQRRQGQEEISRFLHESRGPANSARIFNQGRVSPFC